MHATVGNSSHSLSIFTTILQVVGNKARVILCSSVPSTPSPWHLAALSLHSEWMNSADGYGGLKLHLVCSFCKVCNSFLWLIYLNCYPSSDSLHHLTPTVPTSCFLGWQLFLYCWLGVHHMHPAMGTKSIWHTIINWPEQDALLITTWALLPGDLCQRL